MKTVVAFLAMVVVGTMVYGSDVITVEFTQFHNVTAPNGDPTRFEWRDTPLTGWTSWVTVVIKRNDQVIETRSAFQIRQNTENDLRNLASDATVLYADLEKQQQLIEDTIDQINESINDLDQQDKAHTKLTETLIKQREEYERIQAEIDATMEDLRTEEGTGSPGWFEIN